MATGMMFHQSIWFNRYNYGGRKRTVMFYISKPRSSLKSWFYFEKLVFVFKNLFSFSKTRFRFQKPVFVFKKSLLFSKTCFRHLLCARNFSVKRDSFRFQKPIFLFNKTLVNGEALYIKKTCWCCRWYIYPDWRSKLSLGCTPAKKLSGEVQPE